MRPGCCCVHSGSLGLFGCTHAVVGFIRGNLIHLREDWGPCVYSGTLGPFGWTLVVVGSIWCRSVLLGAPWGSFGSFGVVGFIGVRPRGRRVHSGAPWA